MDGAKDLGSIYDRCGAGVGPCGGACRVKIQELLNEVTLKAAKPPDQEKSPPALVEAISLFNRHYYWECHEVLEHEWLEEHGPRKLFYQGLIQASAALYHVLNANPQGVIRLAQESIHKLQAYRPRYMGVELEKLISGLEFYKNSAKEILGQTRSGFDYKLLPYLTIGTEMDTPKQQLP
jgi:hypothetical protein